MTARVNENWELSLCNSRLNIDKGVFTLMYLEQLETAGTDDTCAGYNFLFLSSAFASCCIISGSVRCVTQVKLWVCWQLSP